MRHSQKNARLRIRYLLCSLAVTTSVTLAPAVSADVAPIQFEQEEKPEASTLSDGNPASLWSTEAGLTPDAYDLIEQIQLSTAEGLDPNRYHLEEIYDLTAEAWQPALAAPIDQLMTMAFEQLITDLGQGLLNPGAAQRYTFQKPEQIDPERAYMSLLLPGNTVKSVIESYRQSIPGYEELSFALLRYQEIADLGGWPYIASGATIRSGDFDSRLADIETRLNVTGDLSDEDRSHSGDRSMPYTPAVVEAMRRFQRRHGLQPDGIIGPNTIKALNIPVSKKIENISLNLERMRWMPRNLGRRYILTNIADYRLHLVDQGTEVLSMPVVVGKKKYKTPVFSDNLEWLVVNPTWTVPKSILYRELLPKERRSPGFLKRANFELIREENGRLVVKDPNSIDRSEYSKQRFRYYVRQKPGARNALGKVKFIFPNKYSIYLHDTPSRSLFQRRTRAFSHGCVRVGNPKGLARKLLELDGWDEERFEATYKKTRTKRLHLKERVDNHIVYLTSWVNTEGKVQFRNDIYEHNLDLAEAIKSPNRITWPATMMAALNR